MKLIIDSGGTSLRWALVSNGVAVMSGQREGRNLASADDAALEQLFHFEQITEPLEAVHLYGAGIASPEVAARIAPFLPEADTISVMSDLYGAARGLLGHNDGIICILGTGSNSGLYNGVFLSQNVRPMGYILGDEGSGAALGRRFLRGLYRGDFGPGLLADFEAQSGLDYNSVIEHTYRRPNAGAFLASLVPYVAHYQEISPAVDEAVTREFDLFFSEVVSRYGAGPVALCGGVAAAFAPTIRCVVPPQFEIITIEDSPMEGLIKYHSNE